MTSKSKELLPHAQQLHRGTAHKDVSLRAWFAMGRVVAEQRYAPHHIADLRTVRDVVTRMREMARASRYRHPPFTAVPRPGPYVQQGFYASPVLELLRQLREPARQIKARTGEVHEFHPYFEAFVEEVDIGCAMKTRPEKCARSNTMNSTGQVSAISPRRHCTVLP